MIRTKSRDDAWNKGWIEFEGQCRTKGRRAAGGALRYKGEI